MSLDIKEIASAWWDSYFGNEEQKNLAKSRLEICEKCPSLSKKFKKFRKITIIVCGECGCPISKKIFSSNFNPCPLSKWKEIDESYPNFFNKKKTNLL